MTGRARSGTRTYRVDGELHTDPLRRPRLRLVRSEPQSLTFDDLVADLEAVVEAAGLKQFILLGCCQGGPVAIAYAARHPERVSHLVLYGAYARGKLKRNPSPQDIDEAETMLKLIELGWGRDNPAFRQVYTAMLFPTANRAIQLVYRHAAHDDFAAERGAPHARTRRHRYQQPSAGRTQPHAGHAFAP